MSTNKHAIIRYQALDKCFRSRGKKYFVNDLLEACNEAIYEFTGTTTGIQKRQVYEDIKFMQSDQGWSVSLVKAKDGRNVYYRYEDPNFSINSEPLNESEANQLKDALLTMSRFKGMPQFEWMDEIVTRLEDSFNLVASNSQVIEFEQNPYLKGSEYITHLYHAIVNKQVLEITYQGFKQASANSFHFHPYYLKQYNNRWFVFGLNGELNKIANVALDRIESISDARGSYLESKIDFEEYFEDVVGVSVPEKLKPVTITLRIESGTWMYIQTKPLHGSQKIVEIHDKYTDITLEVIPNFELEILILQYGETIEVLRPEFFRKRIKDRILQLNKKYN